MPAGWKVKNPELFTKALLQGLHDFGHEVFDESQRTVPVDFGTLKDSGELILTEKGFTIWYRAPYAAKQEFGIKPGIIEQVKRHQVKSHTRIYKRKGRTTKKVEVSEHKRGPYERVYKKGVQGRFYVTNAFEKFKPDLTRFIARLARRHR